MNAWSNKTAYDKIFFNLRVSSVLISFKPKVVQKNLIDAYLHMKQVPVSSTETSFFLKLSPKLVNYYTKIGISFRAYYIGGVLTS